MSDAVIDAFSRRRAEIDAQVAAWGRSSASARQSAALATRARKDYGVAPKALPPEWRQRAEAFGLDARAIDALQARPASPEPKSYDVVAEQLLSRHGLTAQASTFDRRDVVQAFAAQARYGVGLAEAEAFADTFLGHGDVVTLAAGAGGHVQRGDVIRRADGRVVAAITDAPRYSTVGLLATEQQVIEHALARRDEGAGLVDAEAVERVLQARPTLGGDQAQMVRRLCTDGHGVQVVVGPPGTGKTFALDAAREAWQANGFTVCGAAVARNAARGLWDSAGIESTSVAALLGELRRGQEWAMAARSVLVVDEAGMLGTRNLAELLSHAGSSGAKVVLVGDHHQLPEIDAGGAFRALVARTGPIRLTVNRRQSAPHAREMLELWRQARVRDALTIAYEHGDLVMAANANDVEARIVGDYCAAIDAGDDAVMITQRRADARNLNMRARAWLDATGRLGSQRIVLGGGEFAVGDHVVLKLNDRRLGVENGNRGRVIALDQRDGTVSIEVAGGRAVTLPREYLHRKTAIGDPTLVHAYAGTAHIAQGITTGQAFVLGSETAYREWGYVAWSRARIKTRFYICEPDADQPHDEHHTAQVEPRNTLDDIVNAMQRTRAQQAALEFIDPVTGQRVARRRDASPSGRGRHVLTEARAKASKSATSSTLRARRDPPSYIVGALGERPAHAAHGVVWDRGVLGIEAYRKENGVTCADDALGSRPADLLTQVAWREAARDIERCRRELTRAIGLHSHGRSL